MRIAPLSLSSLAVACLVVACADGTAPGARQPVSVSFTTTSTLGATASTAGVTPERPLNDVVGSDALVITKAQLVVARMELARVDASCTSEEAAGDDDHGDDNECAELELAPRLVDLPVSGTIVDALSVSIPTGTYSKLEAKVRPIGGNRGHGSAAFLAEHPELEGVSVLVQGTFKGEPFTFTSDVSTGAEQHFDPPIVVGGTPLNVTIHVDLATWFVSRAGGLIDPRTATPGTENASLVAQNIKRSFRAFRDDDRDGHDDHDEHEREGGHH